MNLELSRKQFRRLLDLVYIGNWILNSTRGDQRFTDYDEVESLLFGRAALEGMPSLAEDLARRDMDDAPIDESNYDELTDRIDAYIAEFEEHGTDNILVDLDTP